MSTQPNGRRRVNRFAADDSDVIVVIGSGAGGGTLASELCQRGAKVVLSARRVGYQGVSTGRMAINSVPRAGRPATIQDGFNYQGDKHRAHWSTLTAEIPVAAKTGRLDLRPESMAIRIEHDGSGTVTGVVYVDAEGSEQRQQARVVCVAGNAIETARTPARSPGGIRVAPGPPGAPNDSQ